MPEPQKKVVFYEAQDSGNVVTEVKEPVSQPVSIIKKTITPREPVQIIPSEPEKLVDAEKLVAPEV